MPSPFSKRAAALLAAVPALTLALASVPALADDQPDEGDPGVARLSVLSGGVDVKRSDSGEAYAAAVNAPVVSGDYLTTRDGSRAEVEYTYGASLRVAPDTQIRFTKLDPDSHAVQLAQGTVELRVLRGLESHPEVDTPGATVRPDGDGRFRVSVEDDGNTVVTARSGRVDVVTQAGTQTLAPDSSLLVTGTGDDAQFRSVQVAQFDDFDRWNDDRDASLEHARDYGYVDQGIVGADDLDSYGRWSDVAGYGQVWQPSVDPGWSPYHDGRWTWEPYYGWTWVAAEPWGWAPYHYGRWFYADNAWCWYPGVSVRGPIGWNAPVYYGRPVGYSPALVAFFSFGGGGGGISIGFGNVGWVPLAPFETYRPWWGRGYGGRGYGGVTNITNITNVTNNYNTYNNYGSITRNYRNARVAGGALGVPATNFAGGNFRHISPVTAHELTNVAPIRGIVPVVPTSHNLAFTDRAPAAGVRPSALESRFAHFSAPKVAVRSFSEQQRAVQQQAVKAYPQNASAFERPAEPAGNAEQRRVAPVEGTRVEGSRADGTRANASENASRSAERGTAGEAHPSERTIEDRTPSSPWDRFGSSGSTNGTVRLQGGATRSSAALAPENEAHRTTTRSEATLPSSARERYSEPAAVQRTSTNANGSHVDPFSRFGSTRTSAPSANTYSPATTARSRAPQHSLPTYASPEVLYGSGNGSSNGSGATRSRTSSTHASAPYQSEMTVPHRPSYANESAASRSSYPSESRTSRGSSYQPEARVPREGTARTPRATESAPRERAPAHAETSGDAAHEHERPH